MTKLYRRSWEKQKWGRTGAITNPLPARSGTDGAVTGASLSSPTGVGTPISTFTSASASFVSDDVGRKIRVTGTPSNRYDGLYVIDAVTNGTTVELRANHNTGAPNSPARFFESATGVSWTILPSCTFTADQAGDIETWFAGSYLTIEAFSNVSNNNGQWLISHRVSNQTVVLSKSWYYTHIDNTTHTAFSRDDLVGFTAETNLEWFVSDRETLTGPDLHQYTVQTLIDAGWTLFHQRGSNSTLLTVSDVILKSVGETDAAIPGGKNMFIRVIFHMNGRSSIGVTNSGTYVSFSGFLQWDPTATATAPGDGSAPMPLATSSVVARTAGTTGSNTGDIQTESSVDFLSSGRDRWPHEQDRRDFVFFGDADAVYLRTDKSANQAAAAWSRVMFGMLKPLTANTNILTVTNAPAAGSNVNINVGTVNAATLGYSVGDNVTLVGYRGGSTKEYLETSSITAFDNTDTSNRLITVAALALSYGGGPNTMKAQIGEDPFPFFGELSSTNTFAVRVHNYSRLANATGRDYDVSNWGSAAAAAAVVSGHLEGDPNRRTGRFSLNDIIVRNTVSGEIRGTFRHLKAGSANKVTLGTKLITSANEVYVFISPGNTTTADGHYIGPMSKAMAAVR